MYPGEAERAGVAGDGRHHGADDLCEPFGRDRPEHVGEDVEPGIVQVGAEPLAAGLGQLGDEGRRRPRQQGVLMPTWRRWWPSRRASSLTAETPATMASVAAG